MNWGTAKQLLLQNIFIGDHIDLKSQYRKVLKKPDGRIASFRISIGKAAYINLTLQMLEDIFNATIGNDGVYNRGIIYSLYPQKVDNHGCNVHVVGCLFVNAGLMRKEGNNFIIV